MKLNSGLGEGVAEFEIKKDFLIVYVTGEDEEYAEVAIPLSAIDPIEFFDFIEKLDTKMQMGALEFMKR